MEQALTRAKWSESKLPADVAQELARYEEGFTAAMDDDLNTAQAMGHVFGVVRLAGRLMEDKTMAKNRETAEILRRILDDLAVWGSVLGVLGTDSQTFLAALKACRLTRLGIDAARVDNLVAERQEVRKAKDFARSDAIRDELAGLGVTVMDTPAGPQWDIA
jgi:cysteinyl-tRNA synthetase